MKRTAIALVLALACSLAAATTVSAETAPPCTPKVTKTGGKLTSINCGPATAQVTLKGKTYKFKSGFCQLSKSTGALELSLGTLVLNAKGNAGTSVRVDAAAEDRPSKLSGSVFEADLGGKKILGDTLIDANGFRGEGHVRLASVSVKRRLHRLLELPRRGLEFTVEARRP